MTREEAIDIMKVVIHMLDDDYDDRVEIAIQIAIEALQEPKKIIGIDMPYESDKGVATIFKVADGEISLEEVEEIKPVKHGEWIEIGKNKDGTHSISCSRCKRKYKTRGHARSWNVKEKYRWCPYCGAKMNGGKE